jgi:hypothetical protein
MIHPHTPLLTGTLAVGAQNIKDISHSNSVTHLTNHSDADYRSCFVESCSCVCHLVYGQGNNKFAKDAGR